MPRIKLKTQRGEADWRPLLEGATAKQALEAVQAIAEEIQRLKRRQSTRTRSASGGKKRQDASLAGGTSGLAIFFAYLSRASLDATAKLTALRFLNESRDALASVTMDSSLYGGFAGIAWATVHLREILGNGRAASSTETVDTVLKDYVNRLGWLRDYDLVIGLVGLGVYALERLPFRRAVACLEGIVDRLDEISVRRPRGLTWHTATRLLPPQQREKLPRGYDNLGMAHGVPGVVAFLGAVRAAGLRQEKAGRLLRGAVDWLLAQKLENSPGARFPTWVAPGEKPAACRSAWCYGDPGVAAALFVAARCMGREDWEREALEFARGAGLRSPEEAEVLDATLCHGAAGLGHIFNRLYQATGDEALAGAARSWFGRALAMRRPGRGIAGFSTMWRRPNGRLGRRSELGILTGAAGVGLALLAATTSIEPEWDRMLLLSMRSVGERRKGESER